MYFKYNNYKHNEVSESKLESASIHGDKFPLF